MSGIVTIRTTHFGLFNMTPRYFTLIFAALLITVRVAAADTNEFMISYWAGPPTDGNFVAQYAEVAECNFTHAMFPVNGASPEQNKAILDACQKHGLKFIPHDDRVLARAPED